MHGNATILKKLVAAERKENRVALSGAACRTLLKLRDNIYGVLCLVLPPKWGRTEVVIQASDITRLGLLRRLPHELDDWAQIESA